MDYHPKIGQPATIPTRAQHEARRILEAVYKPEELDRMPAHQLLREAQAFEDARGAARTTGRWT